MRGVRRKKRRGGGVGRKKRREAFEGKTLERCWKMKTATVFERKMERGVRSKNG